MSFLLGGKKGGETQTGTSSPSPWVEDASRRGVGYAEDIFNRGPTPYGGERVASLSENEKQAGALAGQDRYSPMLDRSEAAYARGGAASRRTADEGVPRYLNTYRKGALDVANDELGKGYTQRQNQLRGQAASRGAFGTSRQTMLEGQNQQDYLKAQGNLYATGLADAYDKAIAASQADLMREQQGAFGEGAGYGNLGISGASLTNDQIRALMATGEAGRSVDQGRLDTSYEQYLREQDQQRQDLDRFLASLRAGDAGRTTTSTGTSSGRSGSLGLNIGSLFGGGGGGGGGMSIPGMGG